MTALALDEERNRLFDYKKIVDTVNSVIVTNADGVFTFVNDKTCESTGYTRASLLGRNFDKIRHPDDEKLIDSIWEKVQNKEFWQGQLRYITKEEEVLYFTSSIAPITDEKGVVKEVIAMQHDITQQIEQENELENLRSKEENQRLSSLVQQQNEQIVSAVPLPSLIIDNTLLVQQTNELFTTLFDLVNDKNHLDAIQTNQFNLNNILTPASLTQFQSYTPTWIDLYNNVYEDNNFIVMIETTNYKVKLHPLDNNLALIVLVEEI